MYVCNAYTYLCTLQNLERYLKETFPSEKFHTACRIVKSTKRRIELVIPRNLERDQGCKIVSDKGYEVRILIKLNKS